MAETDVTLPEREYWEQEAKRIRLTGLTAIRGAADKWLTTIGTLLGLIGTVAFIKGPDSLDKLPERTQNTLIIFVAMAAVFAVVAVTMAALAAQGIPKRFKALTGATLAENNDESAEQAVAFLNWSRGLAVCAAVALVAGTLIAWTVGLHAAGGAKGVSAVVVTENGGLMCGVLNNAEGTLSLVNVDKTVIPLDNGVKQFTVVDSCPTK